MSNGRSVLPFSKWMYWFREQPEYGMRLPQSEVPAYIARSLSKSPVLDVREVLTDSIVRSLSGAESQQHRVAMLLRFVRLMYRNTILPMLAAVNAETEELTLRNFYVRHVYIAQDRGARADNDASGLLVVRTARTWQRLELKITLFQLAPPAPYAFVATSLLTDWSALWSDEAFDASERMPPFNTNIGLAAPVTAFETDVHWVAGILMLHELTPQLMQDEPWQFPTRGSLNRAFSRIAVDLPQHEELANIIQFLPDNPAIRRAILWMHDEVASIFARMQRTMQNIVPRPDAALEHSSSARDQFLIDMGLEKSFNDQARDFLRHFISLFWYARTYEIASVLVGAQE